MGGSIFSGLTLDSLRAAVEAAKQSPEALFALVIVAVAFIAALAFAGAMMAHHLGGFHARIEEEDALAREEEEREALQSRQTRAGTQNGDEKTSERKEE